MSFNGPITPTILKGFKCAIYGFRSYRLRQYKEHNFQGKMNVKIFFVSLSIIRTILFLVQQ